jgi:hypothetical protein
MAIGDFVLYQGRRYVLLGIDPMSVTDRRAELQDPDTGETFRVPLDEVDAADEPPDLRDV